MDTADHAIALNPINQLIERSKIAHLSRVVDDVEDGAKGVVDFSVGLRLEKLRLLFERHHFPTLSRILLAAHTGMVKLPFPGTL